MLLIAAHANLIQEVGVKVLIVRRIDLDCLHNSQSVSYGAGSDSASRTELEIMTKRALAMLALCKLGASAVCVAIILKGQISKHTCPLLFFCAASFALTSCVTFMLRVACPCQIARTLLVFRNSTVRCIAAELPAI